MPGEISEFDYLRAEIEKQKRLKKVNNAWLSEVTGFKRGSINAFMCGRRNGKEMAAALAKALGIKR